MRIRTTATALAVLAALTLAGCSSSSSGSDDDAPAPGTAAATGRPAAGKAASSDKDALTAAVKAYSAAYFKPDPDAGYALLSKRCRAQIGSEAYRTALTQAVSTYGHQAVKSVTVDSLAGDMARVSYTYGVPALNQKGQPWVREGGDWRYDSC
jgi:hypothetical protein